MNIINKRDMEERRLLQLIGMSLKVPGTFSPEWRNNIIEVVIPVTGDSSPDIIINYLSK